MALRSGAGTGHELRLHPVSGQSDARLIAASLRDPETFTELFERYWDELYRFCLRRAGAGGEDVAAETFSRAFRLRARYDGRYRDARAWLYGIATHVLADHFRALRREELKRNRLTALLGRTGGKTQLSAVERNLLDPDLIAVLAELAPGERDALLLAAWAELDYSEIALALHVPVGTVRSRIHRARTRLRAHLKPSEHNPARG